MTQELGKRAIMMRVDITDYEGILHTITKFDIEYVFHLAAQPLVDVAYYNPRQTLISNIVGTVNILEAARMYPRIQAVVVASSDKAYGKANKKRYIEEDPLRGDHPYEVSKSAADLITTSYNITYDLPVTVARFGNVYGEGDLNFSRIIPGLLLSQIAGKTLEIRSDGSYVRDYVYVKDVVAGYIALAHGIEKSRGEAFNFGGNDDMSVVDLIDLAAKVLDKKVSYKILNTAKNEIPYQALDYTKVTKTLGWEPQFGVESVLSQIQKWYYKYYLGTMV